MDYKQMFRASPCIAIVSDMPNSLAPVGTTLLVGILLVGLSCEVLTQQASQLYLSCQFMESYHNY